MKPNFWNNYTCKHKVVVIKADSKTKKQWLLSCRASGQQCFFARISIIIHQFSLHFPFTLFSLGVSQHVHNITNLWKVRLKIPWLHKFECFQIPKKRLLAGCLLIFRVRNYFFLKKLCVHVLYFRGICFSQCFILSLARYQVSFCANDYFK